MFGISKNYISFKYLYVIESSDNMIDMSIYGPGC